MTRKPTRKSDMVPKFKNFASANILFGAVSSLGPPVLRKGRMMDFTCGLASSSGVCPWTFRTSTGAPCSSRTLATSECWKNAAA
eukprot:CAMPEP_0115272010 /NCGR_PEP_ID=MMETSP0270-20121206/54399_1 /TAXON_ID=71861 /ORGANISM="Scrippsiella trochoidea, Strain CCMP3099" /LENGTH=83 /DNA_ID=CAMNT_0002688397 /DNA_START=657 /DNA_END=908 /DNA_ORIENTATION=+